MEKVELSIIIVSYKAKKELLNCLSSIYNSKTKVKFEVIIIDNDENSKLNKNTFKKFLNVSYIKSGRNLGYGGGNNLGAQKARGRYLFFLNPDTIVQYNTIDTLYEFLKKNKNAGLVSPLILNQDSNTLRNQAYDELTPIKTILSYSFFRKIFPNKTVFSNFLIKDWKKDPIKEVKTIYGAALMISSYIFKKAEKFDEKFFLYFEENDISKRVRQLGYKAFINSNSKIIHKVAQSTKHLENTEKIFSKSRFYYLRKHYGFITALLTEAVIRLNKTTLLLIFILALAMFLRAVNLSDSMKFIGDQGWFYLSARDFLVDGKIPLVGITSSHTWLHQGPLWTYMLSVMLFIFNFNPVSGAYLTSSLGVLTVFLMYKFGSELFSVKTGMVAAIFYAISPLIISFDRMPFDPSPVPFFILLYFYILYKWVNGNVKYFPLLILLIAILYNLELATFTAFFSFALIFIFGLLKNKKFVLNLFNRKTIFYSISALTVPMVPIIIYDFSNGFKQTIIFLGWVFYKPLSILINQQSFNSISNIQTVIDFFFLNLQKIILPQNLTISIIIFTLSIFLLSYKVYKTKITYKNQYFLLLFLLLFFFAGIFVNQTPSDAYLPVVFPFVIFTVAVLFEYMIGKKYFKYFGVALLLVILVSNFFYSYKESFILDYKTRIEAVNKIIVLINNQEYNLIGIGQGSQFESFTMNYEYLLWWKGYPPSKENKNIKILISESDGKINIIKKQL